MNNADLVLLNGKVITIDPNGTIAEAVAVKNNKILKVGATEEIKNLIMDSTKIINVEGKLILPGFIDAHVHLASTAVSFAYMLSIHSPPIKSISEILKKVKEETQQMPKGRWIIGRGSFMQLEKLIEKRYPSKSELDEVAPNNPVVLMAGMHLSMLNSMALKFAGITKDTPPPKHGFIYKDPVTGEPTGMLSELYHTLPIPEWTFDQMREAVKKASQQIFIQQGITTIHEIPESSQSIRICQELIENNEIQLRVRVYPIVPRQIELDCLLNLGFRSGFGDKKFRLGGIKIFIDGGTSGKGAAMYEPYDNDPKTVGSLAMTPDKLSNYVLEAHKAGLQVLIHACGDKGQDTALDAIESALKNKPMKDHRHRIEHAGNYFATPKRIDRMKNAGIIPSPNPQMLNAFGDFLESYFGERAKEVFSFRSLLEKGIKYPITSDSTGTQPESTNPLWGIWCAVARRTYNGKILCPQEKITVLDAIKMYTINAAYAGFEEDIKGSIEPGKLADIIILSEDITSIPVDKIKDTEVDTTIIDGKIVYQR